MRYRSAKMLGVTVVAFIAALLIGCSGSSDHLANSIRTQTLVDSNWNEYKQTHGLPVGGLSIYIESPSVNYFASSCMQTGIHQNTRFRIASNTKTFTSAAIMLLNQQGKLHIN